MNSKKITSAVLLITFLLPISLMSQSKWAENDDMYFSKKDREKLQIASSYSNEPLTTNEPSEYFNNHNFSSPTMQSATAGSPTIQTTSQLEEGQLEDVNNQYFISDYSIHHKMDNEAIRFSEITPNSNRHLNSGVNVNFMVGSTFGSPWGAWGHHNTFMDPFSPFNDPFWGMRRTGVHHNSWAFRRNMGMMGWHNPWAFGGNMGMMGWHDPWAFGGGMGMMCWSNPWAFGGGMGMMGQNVGFNNFARNRQPEVRYRNGRRVISGSRGTTNRSRSASQVATTNRAIKNSNPNATVSPNRSGRTSSQAATTNRTTQSRRSANADVSSNGRSNTNARMSRGSHRKYPNSIQNRRPSSSSNNRTNRVNTHRTNRNSNSSWDNNSNANRSNTIQRSGSSSGRSSNFSRPSSGGSRSTPSSGGSRSSGRRGN